MQPGLRDQSVLEAVKNQSFERYPAFVRLYAGERPYMRRANPPACSDMTVVGHTGGGPGSGIAVYRRSDARPRTAAAFSPGDDQGEAERRCVLSLASSPAKEEA